ncbi:hypothetical protein [Aeromicrobium alkaliterrae]|uniref:Preprotein translocase subunit YajC n=1 Tax=Aeromicrobium alkaliterrae TaxID=302168 RepID=A0ABP4VN56_9ACTN
MNNTLYVVLGAALLVLVWFLPRIRRRARRWGNDVGTKAGQKFADNRLPGALAGLGATLVLETNQESAAQVVSAAAATKPKRFRSETPGLVTAKFVEADDVRVRLVPAGSGTQLQVESFRDYMQFPQGLREWEDLQQRVTAAAQAAGVPVRPGGVVTYERTQQLDASNWRWTRTD